jgi:hypothetical protein
MAVRDLPRLPQSPPECIEREGTDNCSFTVAPARLSPLSASLLKDVPDSVTWVDFLPYVCPEGVCPAVMGNVVTFYDKGHLNATFAATLAPVAAEFTRAALAP